MSLLKNCDECNMTCCPNYDPDSIKGLGEKMAKKCMEKIRKNVEKELNPSFIEEMKEISKEESIRVDDINDLFDDVIPFKSIDELYERYDLKEEKVE